uniref:Prospero homeobox protein 2-like n=1 Tax=Pogona vitticeps TaxID=103695 RepID=A0ABM5FAW3_9SAUR
MNGNTVSHQYNFDLSSRHTDGQEGKVCAEKHNFFSPPSYYASIIAYLLSQPEAHHELDPRLFLPFSQKTELPLQNSGHSPSSFSKLPVCGFGDTTQFHHEHLQAKRSRVENIIRGMSITPNPPVPGPLAKGDQHHAEKAKESCGENKRKQKRPQQQNLQGASLAKAGRSSIQSEEYLQLKKQLHVLQYQLKQLREIFFQAHELSVSGPSQEDMEQTRDTPIESYGQSVDRSHLGLKGAQHKDNLWRSIPNMRGPGVSEKEAGVINSEIPASGERNFSEILKQELVERVKQAVDSVLKKVLSESPGLQSHQPNDSPETASSAGRRFPCGAENMSSQWLPKISSPKGSISTISEKTLGFSTYSIVSKMEKKLCQIPPVKHPWILTSSEVPGGRPLGQMLQRSPNDHGGYPPQRTAPSSESQDVPWQPVKLKSSVMRRQPCPVGYKSEIESLAFVAASDAEFAEMHAMADGTYFPSIHISFMGSPISSSSTGLRQSLNKFLLGLQLPEFSRQLGQSRDSGRCSF